MKIIYTNSDLEAAIIFATQSHSGQVRKGDGRLYIMHPMSVMARLYKYKGDSINIILLAICAILHDVYEDCNITIEEITNRFGQDVSDIVLELSSDKVLITLIGKTEYLKEKMRNISSYSLVIKLCDRLDNVNDVARMSSEFITKSFTETLNILDYISVNRKLSNTHKAIIKDIYKIISTKV
jgi:(p)ppGpp synthase/HD superfamily hydrolase